MIMSSTKVRLNALLLLFVQLLLLLSPTIAQRRPEGRLQPRTDDDNKAIISATGTNNTNNITLTPSNSSSDESDLDVNGNGNGNGNVNTASLSSIGDTICVEGYIMDYFCIQLGRLLDNSLAKTLEEPELHSIHCLVDVNVCVDSPFEVLIDGQSENPTTQDDDNGNGNVNNIPSSQIYKRGWRISEESKSVVIELAHNVGVCSNCNGNGQETHGLRAALLATVIEEAVGDPLLLLSDDNDDTSLYIPPVISIQQAVSSSVSSSVVGGDPCQAAFGIPTTTSFNNNRDVGGITTAPTTNPTVAPVTTTSPPSKKPSSNIPTSTSPLATAISSAPTRTTTPSVKTTPSPSPVPSSPRQDVSSVFITDISNLTDSTTGGLSPPSSAPSSTPSSTPSSNNITSTVSDGTNNNDSDSDRALRQRRQ
jgi:hypothetical protein